MRWVNSEDIVKSILEIVKSRDIITYWHLIRVSNIVKMFGCHLNLPDETVEGLYYSGLFHDIGKIVFKYIHYSSTLLSPKDFELVRLHPIISVNVIEPLVKDNLILSAVKYHHERMDGKGYPDNLVGDEIPYGARFIAIVDSFDAIRWRPYNGNKLKDIEFTLEKMCLENNEADDICQWDRVLFDKFYLFCLGNKKAIEDIYRFQNCFVLQDECV